MHLTSHHLSELDKTMACIGLVLSSVSIVWLTISIGRATCVIVGLLLFSACAIYFVIRRTLSSTTLSSLALHRSVQSFLHSARSWGIACFPECIRRICSDARIRRAATRSRAPGISLPNTFHICSARAKWVVRVLSMRKRLITLKRERWLDETSILGSYISSNENVVFFFCE